MTQGTDVAGGKEKGVRQRPPGRLSLSHHQIRLAVGLGLVALSVAGVWLTMRQVTTYEDFLVATEPIAAGTRVTDVEWGVVALGSGGRDLPFVRPDELAETDQRVLRTDLPIGAPLVEEQLRSQAPSDYTTFTATIALGGAPWLVPGATVEVWTSPPQADQTFAVPIVVSPLALVSGVRVDEGFAADTTLATVDLVVHRRELPELIHARANRFDIQLSPATGEWGDPR